MQIPDRIWDILLDSEFPFDYIGAPSFGKVTRGKKRTKAKPVKEASTGKRRGRPKKAATGKQPRKKPDNSNSGKARKRVRLNT